MPSSRTTNIQSTRLRSTLVGCLSAAFSCFALLGCGPTLYTAHILPASRVVEQAEEAGAAENAPYEYYYALEHLKKAREEASEASYQDATAFARLAEEYGVKARDLSRRRMREMGR